MAYFALLWKARIIEKYRLKYEKEKHNSIRLMNAQNSQKTTKTLYQRWCNYNCNTKKRISKTFLKHYPEGSKVYNFLLYLKTDQTFPNFVMKSVIGFVTGIILTYLCFMFFVFQLSISLIHATIMSSIIGVLLTLGLAFSYRIRCLVFLLIPQFFSRIGRYTLTCYALVLILTGPATNTLKNSEVLSESLACAEEQVKTNMHQINESVKKPYNSLKDSIGLLVSGVKQLAAKIKMMTIHLHRLTMSIAYSLQSSFTWLNAVADSCNRKLGTPYKYCQEAIRLSILECQAALGPLYSWVCDAAKLTQVACWPVMPLTAFCHALDFSNGNILGVVKKKLNTFTERVNSMLYLEVSVHHSYSFNSNSSKSASQVAAGIVTEIRTRADMLLTWLSWSSCVTSLSLLLIIFRAKYYQHMYETRSRFDNRYVTKELIDLDLKRLRQGKETVLPLNRREEGKYIKTTSFQLVSSEKVHLSRSAVTMAITTFKLTIHMVADYSLYWVLMTIRHHGLYQTPLKPGQPNVGTHVSGSALISKILMSLIGAITLPLATPPPSTITCLPNPHPPDFQRYFQIGILIFLLWFFALFEPYGLRLRHIIMGLYRPERAKARAVWLFNHLQRTRGSFIKFARRKLHREYKYFSENELTLRRWLQTHVPFIWLKTFLGIHPDDPYCFLCGIIECCNKCDGSFVRCQTPGCPGTYCTKCFSDIGQLCTICMSPADYGDLSDVSLEKGSSAESDDDDNSESSSSPGRREFSTLQIEDDENTGLLSKKGPEKKRRWSFSRKNKTNEQNENFLFEATEDIDISVFKKEKVMCKALTVRHMKFTDFDIQNEQRKAVLSLGQDAACLNHCNICTKTIVNSKLQQIMYYTTNETGIVPLSRNKGEKNKKTSNQKDVGNESKHSKESSSLDVSFTKFIQHFQNMRKYAWNRRSSHPIIRTRSKRILLIRIPNSLKNRQVCRKQRTRLKILTRTQNTTNIPKTYKSAEPEKHKKKKCRHKPLESKIMRLACTIRRLSSTITQGSQNVDKDSDIYFQFNDNNVMNAPKFVIMDCKDDAIPGPSDMKTDKKKPAKKKPNKKKENKQKHTNEEKVNEKQKQRVGKLHEICSSCWKNGRLFSPPKTILNFFRTDHVPALYSKKNHKKRKKVGKSEEMLTSPRKTKEENEATRKYRISTYLSEQDWIQKQCTETKPADKINTSKDGLKDLFDTDTDTTKLFFKKADRREMGDRGDTKNMKKRPAVTRNNRKHHSPDIKKTKPLSQEAHYEDQPLEPDASDEKLNLLETKHPNRLIKDIPEEDVWIMSKTSRTPKSAGKMSMPRSLDYFRSIGNYDFDPFVNLEEPNPENLEKKESSNKSLVVMDVVRNEQSEKETEVLMPVVEVKSQTQEKPLKTIIKTPAEILMERVSPCMIDNQTYKPGLTKVKLPGCLLRRVPSCTRCRNRRRFYVDEDDSKRFELCFDLSSIAEIFENCCQAICDFISCEIENISCSCSCCECDNPMCCCRKGNIFTRLFRMESKNKEEKKRCKCNMNCLNKVDVQVEARPCVGTCYCQYGETIPILDQTTQVLIVKDAAQSTLPDADLQREIGIDALAKMRSGTTQYSLNLRNVATYFQAKKPSKQKPICKDASTIHFNALRINTEKETMSAPKAVHSFGVQCLCSPKSSHQCPQKRKIEFQQQDKTQDATETSKKKGQDTQDLVNKVRKSCYCGKVPSSLGNGTSSSLGVLQSIRSLHNLDLDQVTQKKKENINVDDLSLNSENSSESEDTKTDTTVYRLSSIEYGQMPRKQGKYVKIVAGGELRYLPTPTGTRHDVIKQRRFHVKVVTKSNRATATDPAKLRDVSTATSDWWSPILERKNQNLGLPKNRSPKANGRKYPLKDIAVSAEGKIVTFKSNTELIPSMHTQLNLMSPYRYLLESQKYYNELFNYKDFRNWSSTSTTTERHSIERKYSPSRRYFLKKRKDHNKSKKYDDDYAPLRQFSPFREYVWLAEAKRMKSSMAIRRNPRTPDMKHIKMAPQSKSCQNKGVEKVKNPKRLCLKKPELRTKKGEVNLLYRQCLSNDHLSLDCLPVSITETSSL